MTNRLHCIVWSDWSTHATVERANGIRLDTNYYYWPGTWVQNRPGFMTGSGMPMRFADSTGKMIDIYQAATQMTDESGQSYPFTPDTLLDNALGSLGYYGAFTANMHTDTATTQQSDALLASAQSHGVPIVSGKQMTHLDRRPQRVVVQRRDVEQQSLSFTVKVGAGAAGLTGMLPTAGPNGTRLTGITHGGAAVTTRSETIKGLEYAIFDAAAGGYIATYGAQGALAIAAVSPDTGPAVTEQTASLRWTTTNIATSEVSVGTSASKLTTTKVKRDATRKHAMSLTGLKPGTTYYYRVTSTDATGARRTFPAVGKAPATFVTPEKDSKKPSATSPILTALPDGTARVEWTTSEAATGTVDLGSSAKKLVTSAAEAEASRQHSLVVTGLVPDSTYWIRTTSTDAAGNVLTSKAIRLTTPAAGVAEQMAASFRRGKITGQATIDEARLGSITLGGARTKARQGTFTSGLLDAQAMVDWDRMVSRTVIPKGSSLVVKVRTGSTETPDRTWSGWKAVTGKQRVTGSSRLIQYEVVMTGGAGSAAPELRAIGFTANGGRIVHEGETR